MIVSRTPLRFSLFGGGSDLPAYYRRCGGAVLSTTIDKSVYVTVNRKFDNSVRVSYSRTEEVNHASDVSHPLVRECLAFLGIEGGVEITSVADIPAKGTGLGSSSAFTVGLLNALHAFLGRKVSSAQLAAEACQIEIERCGEPIGKQDQYAAAFGGFNFIRFNADETVNVEPVHCRADTLMTLQERSLFFYTGVTRSASTLLREQSAAVVAPGAASDDTGLLVTLAETARNEIMAGRIDGLGPMLDEAWRAKRQLSSSISSHEIDRAYQVALDAGAEGGKILGAGGGGFLMFLAPPERHDDIRNALGALRETPFRFSSKGSSVNFFGSADANYS